MRSQYHMDYMEIGSLEKKSLHNDNHPRFDGDLQRSLPLHPSPLSLSPSLSLPFFLYPSLLFVVPSLTRKIIPLLKKQAQTFLP